MANRSSGGRGSNRILATHTGSLPRPAKLMQLLVDRSHGRPADPAEIERESQAALRWIVPKQIEVGIDIGNDGEQQREQFFRFIQRRLTGFGGSWNRRTFADINQYPGFKAIEERLVGTNMVSHKDGLPKAIGEVKLNDTGPIRKECDAFREVLSANGNPFVDEFITSPSPGLIAKAMPNEYYDTEQAYLDALGAAMRIEYETIASNGFVLQIDAPDLGLERHVTYQDRPLSDFLDFVARVIDTINKAIANIPKDKVRLHVCWGNYEGPHNHDVPLGDIMPVLAEAKVGGFVLPFANGRHAHEYRCLEKTKLADDQVIIAGVIDNTTNFIEHPETVADRIERIASVVGPERVMAGTDCGFETSAGRRRVAEDVAWAKLKSLSEGAKIASERLFANSSAKRGAAS